MSRKYFRTIGEINRNSEILLGDWWLNLTLLSMVIGVISLFYIVSSLFNRNSSPLMRYIPGVNSLMWIWYWTWWFFLQRGFTAWQIYKSLLLFRHQKIMSLYCLLICNVCSTRRPNIFLTGCWIFFLNNRRVHPS